MRLTKREKEVVVLIMKRKSTRQIAKILGIKEEEAGSIKQSLINKVLTQKVIASLQPRP